MGLVLYFIFPLLHVDPCFLNHYCIQIQYTTNFLIDNVFIHLDIAHVVFNHLYDQCIPSTHVKTN